MNPGLREHKSASLRIAIPQSLPVEMWEGVREIVGLKSEAQNKGHATLLMWTVCHEADVAGKVLMLKPDPFAEGMDSDKLKKWYGKFLFTEIQQEPCVLMARQPMAKQIRLAS